MVGFYLGSFGADNLHVSYEIDFREPRRKSIVEIDKSDIVFGCAESSSLTVNFASMHPMCLPVMAHSEHFANTIRFH